MMSVSKDNWFEELIRRAKEIQANMELDIWKRYAECGRLLIETGYTHSLEARGFLKNFMEAMNIRSRTTITFMLQLGRKNDQELVDAINNYRTIYNFSHRLPITEGVAEYKKERKKPPRECKCGQGNPGFPRCCVLCQYYEKKKV